MKVTDLLSPQGHACPSLEIVPPLNGMKKDDLLATIGQMMEFAPRFINVTSHRDEYKYTSMPDGSYVKHLVRNRISPVAVCGAIMSKYNVELVPHIICGGRTSEEIESELHNLRFMGISNVMALRGDSISGEKRFLPTPGGFAHANELVESIRNFSEVNGADFCIGVGGYPEKHFEAANMEEDIANLKRKVDAGADYVVTQMFFDNKVFYDFVDRCRQAGITVPILPGLKPLSSARQLGFLPESFSIDIPVELTEAMRKASTKEEAYHVGKEWCIMQSKDLIAHGVKYLHYYTMGSASNIVEILKACF